MKQSELSEEFRKNGQVTVFLRKEESAELGRIIQDWYQMRSYRRKPKLLQLLFRYFYQYKWKRRFKNSFREYPDANEVFRFYILFKGKEQIQIEAIDDISDPAIKQIRFHMRDHV